MICWLVLTVNWTQPRIAQEKQLREKLSRAGWPSGMSVTNCLIVYLGEKTQTTMGSTIPQAGVSDRDMKGDRQLKANEQRRMHGFVLRELLTVDVRLKVPTLTSLQQLTVSRNCKPNKLFHIVRVLFVFVRQHLSIMQYSSLAVLELVTYSKLALNSHIYLNLPPNCWDIDFYNDIFSQQQK